MKRNVAKRNTDILTRRKGERVVPRVKNNFSCAVCDCLPLKKRNIDTVHGVNWGHKFIFL